MFPSTSLANQQSHWICALFAIVLTMAPWTVYANSFLGALNARSHFRSVGSENGSRYRSSGSNTLVSRWLTSATPGAMLMLALVSLQTTIQFDVSRAAMSRMDRDASGSVSNIPISRLCTALFILNDHRNLSH